MVHEFSTSVKEDRKIMHLVKILKHFPIFRNIIIIKRIIIHYDFLSCSNEAFHSANKTFHCFINRINPKTSTKLATFSQKFIWWNLWKQNNTLSKIENNSSWVNVIYFRQNTHLIVLVLIFISSSWRAYAHLKVDT